MQIPQLPPLPPPAECTRPALASFSPELSGLPTGFAQLDREARAKALLSGKLKDSQQYRLLRAQALRCAR